MPIDTSPEAIQEQQQYYSQASRENDALKKRILFLEGTIERAMYALFTEVNPDGGKIYDILAEAKGGKS